MEGLIKKYWSDLSRTEYERIYGNSIEDLLEKVWNYHDDGINAWYKRFSCGVSFGNGYCEASNCLPERMGYRGTVSLESITVGNTIVFDRGKYISEKTKAVFEKFGKEHNKKKASDNYGEW